MLTIPSAVEEALKKGAQKNFRVHFPNGERADITNDNIVSESVSFTESICSQSELKFGLAEASVLEFETVGVENIRGAEIEASVEVEYGGEDNVLLPYDRGSGSVNGIRYEVNADGSISLSGTATAQSFSQFNLKTNLALEPDYTYRLSGCSSGGGANTYELSVVVGSNPTYRDFGSGTQFTGLSNASYIRIYVRAGVTVNTTFYPKLEKLSKTYSISYGRFIVDECKRQTNLEHRKIVAYSREISEALSPLETYKRSRVVSTNTPYAFYPLATALMNLGIRGRCEAFEYEEMTPRYSGSIPFDTGENVTYNIVVNTAFRASANYDGFFVEKSPLSEVYTVDYLANRMSILGASQTTIKNFVECFNTLKNAVFVTPYVIPKFDFNWISQSDYIEVSDLDYGNFQRINIVQGVQFWVNGSLEESYDVREDFTSNFYGISTNIIIPQMSVPRTKIGTGKYVVKDAPEYSMLELLQGCIELLGGFGKFKRDGNFDIISLNDNFSTPDYELSKSDYSQCWYEEAPTLPYGKVECYYTDTNGESAYISKRIQNVNPCLVYNLSENVIVKNSKLTSAQMQDLIDLFASNVTNISYIGSDISAVGLPFLEAGDVLEVEVGDNETIKTFIEKRTLKGIQALFDDISAEADEDYIGQWVEEEETSYKLIENGLYQNGFSFVGKAYRSSINTSNGFTGTPTITENYSGGYVRAYHSATASNGNRACSICSNAKIDLTNYSTLHIEYTYIYQHRGTTSTKVGFVIPSNEMSAQGYAVVKSEVILSTSTSSSTEYTITGTVDLDISDLSGLYHVGADITYRPNDSGGKTDMQIKNMWLE